MKAKGGSAGKRQKWVTEPKRKAQTSPLCCSCLLPFASCLLPSPSGAGLLPSAVCFFTGSVAGIRLYLARSTGARACDLTYKSASACPLRPRFVSSSSDSSLTVIFGATARAQRGRRWRARGEPFMAKCSKCHANVPEQKAFCPECGAPMSPQAAERRQPQADFGKTVVVPPAAHHAGGGAQPARAVAPPPPPPPRPAARTSTTYNPATTDSTADSGSKTWLWVALGVGALLVLVIIVLLFVLMRS
jgi:hypothetical protein